MVVQVALAVAAVAMGALNMYTQGQQVKAQNRVRKAQADAEDTLRPARNQAAAAQSSLALWSQSVNNQRRARSVGLQLEGNAVNSARQRDAVLGQSFTGSIRNAERAGAQMAAAASSGVSGNVVDMVAGATALRRKVGEEATQRMLGQSGYDTARRAAELSSQLVSGLDTSMTMAGIDYNQTILQQQRAVSGTEIAITSAAQLASQLYQDRQQYPTSPAQSAPDYGVQLGEQGGNTGGGFWGDSASGLTLGGNN